MATRNNKPKSYKIILLGDSDVGKTCLQIKYTNGNLVNKPETTVGLDIMFKVVAINGQTKRLDLWDTAGQEIYRAVTASYIRGSSGVILVYDITERKSYESIKYWLHECDLELGNDIPKVIVGNKTDQEESRQVTTREGQKFASELNLPFFETSYNDSVEIDRVFSKLIEEMENKVSGTDSDIIRLEPSNLNKKDAGAGGSCNCSENYIVVSVKDLFR